MATVVNYVVEACADGRPWISVQFAGDDKVIAEKAYENWLAGRSTLGIRLVRRTAIITDKVVCSGRQGRDPDGEEPEWWED